MCIDDNNSIASKVANEWNEQPNKFGKVNEFNLDVTDSGGNSSLITYTKRIQALRAIKNARN